MRNLYMAAIISILACTTANACDICGSGSGNYNPFLFPHLSKNYFGMSYMHRMYHTHNADGTINRAYYNSLVFSGQFNFNSSLGITAILPYGFNQLQNINGISTSR